VLGGDRGNGAGVEPNECDRGGASVLWNANEMDGRGKKGTRGEWVKVMGK